MTSLLRPQLCQQLAPVHGPAVRQQPARPAAGAPQPRCPVACRSTSTSSSQGGGWGAASVLERPHEQHATYQMMIEDASAYESVLQESSSSLEWEREFSDYASATEMMNELESLQAELTSNVSVMDALWLAPAPAAAAAAAAAPPVPTVAPNSEDAERRRAVRRASREARKKAQAQAQAAVQQKQQEQLQQQDLRAAVAPTQQTSVAYEALQPRSPSPPPASFGDDLNADLESLDDLRRQLSQLWQEEQLPGRQPTPSPSTSPPHSPPPGPAPPSLPPQQKQAEASVSLPLVLSPKKEATTFATATDHRVLSTAGPSLALPSTSTLVSSSVARARHQRRADRYSPRPRAAGLSAGSSTANGKLPSNGKAAAPDSTTQFMKVAGKTALLQGNEQKELATVVKDYLLLMRIKSELKNILKRDPTIEEWAKGSKTELKVFISRLEAGQAAKSVMIKSNYRLVVNIVSKYRGRGMEIQDLIAEGMQGLLRSVEKFDADKGFKFSTYAHWWIRQSVSRAISNQTRAVRVPYHMQELLLKLKTAKAKFQEEHNRDPTCEEMATVLKVPVGRVTQALAASIQPKSLDTQLNDGGDDGGVDLKDQLADERSTPEEHFEEEQMQDSVMLVLQELDEREAGIIRMRLGIDGSDMYTLEDIGRTYNVTRERVRQVEAKAMHKLQELAGGGALGVADYSIAGVINDKPGMVARASRGTSKKS